MKNFSDYILFDDNFFKEHTSLSNRYAKDSNHLILNP